VLWVLFGAVSQGAIEKPRRQEELAAQREEHWRTEGAASWRSYGSSWMLPRRIARAEKARGTTKGARRRPWPYLPPQMSIMSGAVHRAASLTRCDSRLELNPWKGQPRDQGSRMKLPEWIKGGRYERSQDRGRVSCGVSLMMVNALRF
jgi:hypothetical protein